MKILTFGEILYDVFDDDTKLGGAPLNFAAHFSRLGGDGYILSAVGNDRLGEQAVAIAESFGVCTKYVPLTVHPTGVCKVSYDGDEPVYDLSAMGAYDNIALTDEQEKAIESEQFDVLYFGTLASRNEVSRQTLEKLFAKKCFKKTFFDINLRQTYYTKELIEKYLKYADMVKINHDEFAKLKDMGMCKDEKSLCKRFDVEMLLLTLGKDGMVLYDAKNDIAYPSSKPKNKVVSTVGAGDASSACFLYNYLMGEPLRICVERASIMGDYIVTFTEAIPDYSEELLKQLKTSSKRG